MVAPNRSDVPGHWRQNFAGGLRATGTGKYCEDLMRYDFLFLSVILFALPLRAQTPAAPLPTRVWEDTVILTTYREEMRHQIAPPLYPNPRGHLNIYPYSHRTGITGDKSPQVWRALHLENQYLHCRILPDLGGHLYSCLDKLAGQEMFYDNKVIKKVAEAAPRGAWAAFGLETSFPIAHSRVSISPVHYASATRPDGSATVFVGAVDRVGGAEYRVAFTLRAGVAALEQHVWLYNRGPLRQPFQWWSNAAVRLPDEGFRITLPTYVTQEHASGALAAWPMPGKLDLSLTESYTEHGAALFAFGSREDFLAVHSRLARRGVAHWADPRLLPGKKMWINDPRPTAEYLTTTTDDRSKYAELQAGVPYTQDQFEFLAPQQSKSFTEYWIPVRDTSGISRANPDAVVYLERKPQPDGRISLLVDIQATRDIPNAVILITKEGAEVWRSEVSLSPKTTFHTVAGPVSASGKFELELKDAAGKPIISHKEDTWDATPAADVKLGPPPKPTKTRITAESFLKAGEEAESKRLHDVALEEYQTGLKRHPGNLDLRKALGRLALNMQRDAQASTELAPVHAANPGDAETTYLLAIAERAEGDDTEAMPLLRSIENHAAWGAAARFELAGALARAGKLPEAAALFAALARDGGPVRAGAMEVALLRRTGQTAPATSAVDARLAASPVDNMLRFEATRLGRADDALWVHLAADPEWVLDLVDDYFFLGLYQDAVALLLRNYPPVPPLQKEIDAVLPQDHPLIAYYRAYAKSRLGLDPTPDLAAAARQSVLYAFPYRVSTWPVLRAALVRNPADAAAHFLLGCLYMNSQLATEALAEWEKAKPGAADLPGYYSALTGYYKEVAKDAAKARAILMQAIKQNPSHDELLALGAAETPPIVPGGAAGAAQAAAAASAQVGTSMPKAVLRFAPNGYRYAADKALYRLSVLVRLTNCCAAGVGSLRVDGISAADENGKPLEVVPPALPFELGDLPAPPPSNFIATYVTVWVKSPAPVKSVTVTLDIDYQDGGVTLVNRKEIIAFKTQ